MSRFNNEEDLAIYCTGIPSTYSLQDFRPVFLSFGPIEKAYLHANKTDSKVLSGVVIFKEVNSAQKALGTGVVKWHGATIKAHKYKNNARPKSTPRPRPNSTSISLPPTTNDDSSSLLGLSDHSYEEIRQTSIENELIRAMLSSFRKASSDKDALEALKDLQLYFYEDLSQNKEKLNSILSSFVKIMRKGVKELSKNGSLSLLCTWFSVLNYWLQIRPDKQRCPDHWSCNQYVILSSEFLGQIPSLIEAISNGVVELLWYRTLDVMAAADLWHGTDSAIPDSYLSGSATSLKHNSSLPMKELSPLCAVELFDMLQILAQNVWGNREDIDKFVKKVIPRLCNRIESRMDIDSKLAKRASDESSEGGNVKSRYKESKKVLNKLASLCNIKNVESDKEEEKYNLQSYVK
eukprot:CAMPEP_0175064216 /NCGR_PEP_ID=MMETSP0052_2-20121109/15195_1 /TAXON_ID=51329 ORGANISM="Polytomella parva, Strain SAG 63-3" /NCGR_SAMPLE_ID=MMETSP0052_2 /ASSEMBLY_ACC=CAM_ASM_000194 /LENGTH=405 /DNA_ID=CAMNT_0016330513 /DNA_START=21 /DNA_END=1238 /DNA_ORIENTATION=-